MPKTAKRSTKPVTPEAAGKKAAALITKLLKTTPSEQAAAAKEKAEREAADRAKREKKRKALQASAERHNLLCGDNPGDTLNNCRAVVKFLSATVRDDVNGIEGLEPDETFGLYLIYETLTDALKRQEQAL